MTFSRRLHMELVNHNNPEGVLWKGQTKYFRRGPWNGLGFSETHEFRNTLVFDVRFVSDKDEAYYVYNLKNESVISRVVMNQTIYARQRLTWIEEAKSWRLFASFPGDVCDQYNLCGPFGKSIMGESPACQCLKGFKPKFSQNWDAMDWTQGCIHSEPWSCKVKNRDNFLKVSGLKLPDTTHSWVDGSMTLEECKAKCLENCSCTAYANSDISTGGSGCIIWFGDLNDIRQASDAGQDLYIRSAVPETAEVKDGGRTTTKVIVITDHNYHFLCFCGATATKNFSIDMKLAQGGFGPVYKGTLDRQEVAVKRLSQSSHQGMKEFMNEIVLCSKLQYQNLVMILGWQGSLEEISLKKIQIRFGVLLQETVSGMKNRESSYPNQSPNLIGHVWRLWKEGMPIKLLMSVWKTLLLYQKCCAVSTSLLCVQQHPDDRPDMASMVMMLSSESDLPQPKELAFLLEKPPCRQESSQNNHPSSSINEMSFTELPAR
ncbi:hypothetical protein K1719_047212 [Acacia pycnantha]|nr:hypothetical protein K1719_047212 [Acacia pycnantha]